MTNGGVANGSGSREPVLDEYYYLQKIVSEINGQCLAVKSWGATIAGAVATFTRSGHTPLLLFVIAAVAVALWFTEAYWRRDQQAFIDRIRAIEDAIAERKPTPSPRISHSWQRYLTRENYWRHLRRWITMLPNAWIALMAVAIGGALWLGPHIALERGSKVVMRVEQPASRPL